MRFILTSVTIPISTARTTPTGTLPIPNTSETASAVVLASAIGFGMRPRRGALFCPGIPTAIVRYVEVDIIAMVRYRRLSAKGSVNESNKPPFPINTQTRRF